VSQLAINGGTKVRTVKFPPYLPIGEEETKAALRVIKSGVLSRFIGACHPDFYGGPEVLKLEKEWAGFYGVKNAIAVNSATSALYCAVGAIGAGPGDEIIVSPYTMSCSAIAPLIFNAIPVFADIEEDYFCLSPESVEARITKHTRAIIVVDLFGQLYDAEAINSIARKHNLYVIEDNAQGPGVKYKNRWGGTLGDIGIFSLNYHKHIHSGEGGIIVTNDDELAEKMRMIRNHAESVIDGREMNPSLEFLVNMVGYNFRMTEIEAAITREQIRKLPSLISERQKNVEYLSQKLSSIPCLETAKVRPGGEHAYYMHAIKFSEEIAGIHRNRFVEAVKAELMPIELRETEGVKVGGGYVKPIYLQPIFQNRVAYGSRGCPWSCEKYQGNADYRKGICTVTEKMHFDVLITHELMRPGMTKDDLDDVFKAFNKVWINIGEIQ
jgi:perosamine synthetase